MVRVSAKTWTLTSCRKLEVILHADTASQQRHEDCPPTDMLRCLLVLPLAALCLLPNSALAQEAFFYDEALKWEDFGVGSWKLVRLYRETLDEKGMVESVSIDDTKSTLVDVSESGCTIKAEVTVEVAGRRFSADPKYFQKSWDVSQASQEVVVGERGVKITGQVYPTDLRTILTRGKDANQKSLVYYSNQVSPYVLRMETKTSDTDGKATYDSLLEVVAVDMPHKVLSEIKTTSHVRILEKMHSTGREKLTVELHCTDVPGWVISHTSKVIDTKQNGRVLERTTLELLDYEARFPEPRKSVMRRRGLRRNRRK